MCFSLMEDVIIPATFGDETKTVTLSIPNGGGDHYQIMVGNYYHGTLKKQNGQWAGHLARKSELTSDDIYIMGEIIDSKTKPL